MEKLNKRFFTLAILSCLLCSCAPSNIHYETEDYKTVLNWKEGFTICQLNDLHLSTSSNLNQEFEYFRKVIFSNVGTTPDLIILDGDTFMDANREIVDKTIAFFDSLNIKYAFAYGNHDLQGFYSSDYINQALLSAKNSVYKNPNNRGLDDVYGRSNYFVDLRDKDTNELKWQIFILDSNTYYNTSYDVIHDDQVEWYKRCLIEENGYDIDTLDVNTINDTTFAKSLAFFHIPTFDFKNAIDDFKAVSPNSKTYLDDYCDVRESISLGNNPTQNGNIVEVMQQYKSTVGIGVGHDHINNTDIHYQGVTDWPIRLIYGMKTGRGIYHDEDIIGGCFYTLHENKTQNNVNGELRDVYFDLQMIHVSYSSDPSSPIWTSPRGDL